jgi:mono/diheme cytochrome c family protein
MRGAVLCCCFLLGLLTIGITRPGLGEEANTPARRGESLLTTNCARCHATSCW